MSEANVATVTVAEAFLKNTDTLRRTAKEQGVGLMALGSWVASEVSAHEFKRSVEAVASKVKFAKEQVAVISKANKGTVVRFGVLSECGTLLEVTAVNGHKGIVSTGIYGSKGSIQVLSMVELATLAKESKEQAYTRQVDTQSFCGRLVGSGADKVASLVYSLDGKRLLAVDMEATKNNYNGEVRGHFGGKAADMAETTARAIDFILASAAKKAEKVAEVKEVKAVKAKKVVVAKKKK